MTRAKKYLDWVAQQPCVKCGGAPVEIAHVRAFRSPKTDDLLPRRNGIASIAVLPLCAACHRTAPDSIHEAGERAFEANLGRGDGYIAQKAASLIAEYYLS